MLPNYRNNLLKKTPQLISMAMRLSGLALRFILLFVLAKYFSLKEVGLFSVYWAALQLSSSLSTLDVYAYTARKILSQNEHSEDIVSRHIQFLFLAILVSIPLTVIIMYLYFVQVKIPLWLIFVLIIHLPIEIILTDGGRILVPLKKPFLSNLILFIRTAAWIPVVCFFLFYGFSGFNVFHVILIWLIGSLVSFLTLIVLIKPYISYKKIFSIDFKWIKIAVYSSAIMTAATLLFRAILGADRFFVGYYFSVESVAIYSLYASIALAVLSLVETGVSAWRYPALVNAIKAKDLSQINKCYTVFFKENFIATTGLTLIILILFPKIAQYFLSEEYYKNINVFYIMCLASFLYCISMPWHYVIFGYDKDRLFIYVYGISFLFMIVFSTFFMQNIGFLGAGIMILLGLGGISVLRYCISLYVLSELRR